MVAFIPAEWTLEVGAVPSEAPVAHASDVVHLPTPEPLKAIYMSQCVVGTPSFRDSLVSFVGTSPLNAVIIDIKDYTGRIAFTTDNPLLKDSVSNECGARDMKAFIKTLHDKGIYVIARITVFQDPYYTKLHPEQSVQSKSRPGEPWKDYKGLSFIDVSAQPYWEYVVALSREAYDLGFDELNYDYIRWPSDGPMSDAQYPRAHLAEEIEKFWKYLAEHVKPTGAVLSADLFGMTTTNTDDLNIGQQLERALPYFDYVMPMVYPSHYPKTFLGLGNPNSDPYTVVNYSMAEAVKRTIAMETRVQTLSGVPLFKTETVPAMDSAGSPQGATTTREVPTGFYSKSAYPASKLRPWLQDFDYGKDYKPEDIEAQIKATTDAGLTSWAFWDAGNRYDNLRKFLATPND
ncbi:hypothetical protein A2841_01460 [Candidatus Kaiserbacteria bacterium RIFCSPHIGHO2_01_FULL_48_10]|uniref:DUF4015 domain-containing protein n=1 Tax=Candidatus Kaiserbacteria bacterium RIFCSPHIGHO2_01_FULL_48_10 TaxID=1798476 RepID=A0A1F6C2Q1_9BACT|nr:MAG: hypothetical protein A2841_01460 [Candidatus Kaiserbacteria bacterium RIFCSPHIGHO2_01_FULL_48_10]